MALGMQIYNPSIVTLSIAILLITCTALIILVAALSAVLFSKRRKTGKSSYYSNNQKHYLTGLPNRNELIQSLEKLLYEGKKDGVNVAFLFIDVDDFNSINASLGHKIGDSLLVHISQIIKNDAGRYTDLIYHIGSDEFAVVLYDFGKDVDTVVKIANDIIHAISQPTNIEGYELHSSCCIGICTFPECADDADSLLKHSGAARDNAKKIGYGSLAFYTQEMSHKSVMRALIAKDLREALDRNEFYLQYQPKVQITTGKIQGAEALLRWHHPSLGNITPDIFIPVIEDLGLIHSVGKWVIYNACRDIKKLHNSGFKNLHIAVNISAHQFNKGDIATVVAEAIWESGIAPHMIELELTEAVVMSDTEKSALMLKVLQSMGVKIAVDDFGTGYSAMNQLTKFPISILKIDKSFIHNVHLNTANQAIVSTMIQMGKQLGFQVVAEGAETQQEVDFLKKEGCELIQGFYYSKPLSLNDFMAFLQQNGTISLDSPASKEQSA